MLETLQICISDKMLYNKIKFVKNVSNKLQNQYEHGNFQKLNLRKTSQILCRFE